MDCVNITDPALVPLVSLTRSRPEDDINGITEGSITSTVDSSHRHSVAGVTL